MDQLSSLMLASVVSLLLSSVITVLMTSPLRSVLRQLCLQGSAVEFWIPFTNVMFFVTPLLFTMLFAGTILNPSLESTLRTALASSLFGAFAALLVVGYQVSKARPIVR